MFIFYHHVPIFVWEALYQLRCRHTFCSTLCRASTSETAQHPVRISRVHVAQMRRRDAVGETLWFLIRGCAMWWGRPSLLVALLSPIQSHPRLRDRIPSCPLGYSLPRWTFPPVPSEYPTIDPPATSSVVPTSFLTSSMLLAGVAIGLLVTFVVGGRVTRAWGNTDLDSGRDLDRYD